ncbi:MAG: hypothetical protein LBQ46_12640 [Treponema sp.]|jgi:hypothetical protein|nr:hypothetical protein [Treponema sp.]
MKNSWTLTFLLVLLCSCGKDAGTLSYEDLQEFTDSLTPYGTYFWDEFGQYRDLYNLGEAESRLLGEWFSLNPSDRGDYYFYPNKLFVYVFDKLIYKNDGTKSINGALGTWDLRGNMVTVTIYGLDQVTEWTHWWDGKHEYIRIDPFEAVITDVREIYSTGYTRKLFRPLRFPWDLDSNLIRAQMPGNPPGKMVKEGIGMIRFLYWVDVITNSGKLEHNYNMFRYVPDMAEHKVSGLDIVSSPDMVYKYFVESFSLPYVL